MRTARLSAEAIELAETAAPILNAAVISDVLVGALLAQAALESAAINVEINAAAMSDKGAAQQLTENLNQARNGVSERVQRVLRDSGA